jgi:hypothetical protein
MQYNYGVWDQMIHDKANIKWTRFRERATLLSKKTDMQLMENLYCVLARCSKAKNNTLSEPDEARAQILERIPEKKCNIILERLTPMRKVHINSLTKDAEVRRTHIRMLPMDKMPKGWTYDMDEKLFNVADTFGINQIGKKLATLSEFKDIELPSNKDLWKRLNDIVATLENGKYGPTDIPLFEEESEDEREDEIWLMTLTNASKQALKSVPTVTPEVPASTSSRRAQNKKKPLTTPSSSKKDINSAHQNFVKQMDQAAYQQNYLLLQAAAALSAKPGSSSNDVVAQIAQLQAILQLANPTMTTSSFNKAIEDALNLSKKDTPSTAAAPSSSKAPTAAATPAPTASSSTPSNSHKHSNAGTAAASSSSSNAAATRSAAATSSAIPQLNPEDAAAFEKAALEQLGIGFSELMVLQSLDPNVTVCMYNPETKHSITGDKAPTLKTLEAWIKTNPKYKVDFNSTLMALMQQQPQQQKPSTSTPKASSSKVSTQNGITPKTSTAAASSSSSSHLEPGEIPKASTSSTKTSNTPATNSLASEYENLTITVFNKKTMMAAANDKHPTIKGLQTYLDKNPDMNVASSHAQVAKAILPKSYHNRIGGDEYFAQLMSMMGLGSNYLTGSLPGTSSTPNFSLNSGTSAGGMSTNNNSNATAQQAFEAQMMLLQQSLNPLNSYNYASMFAGMPATAGTGLTASSLSQFTTPTSSTSTTKASSSAAAASAKPSISAGTSSKSAAAAAALAAAANSSAGTSSTSAISNSNNNNTTASQMLSEAALTAELMNNPQFAQFMAMSGLAAAAGAGTSTTSQSNQLNSLYGMDQNTLNQLQTLSMLSMMSGLQAAAATTPSSATPSSATAKASSLSTAEKKSSTAGGNSTPSSSKKSLGKIVEDLSKTPGSSS